MAHGFENEFKNMKLWEVVYSGKVKVSNTPEELWTNACKYFYWCDEEKVKATGYIGSGGKAGSRYDVEYEKPYSIVGLCLFTGMSASYFKDLLEMPEDNMYKMVADRIQMIIYEQNLEFTAVGLLNAPFMGKLLSVSKPQETTKPVRVEILGESPRLASSEGEVLENLDNDLNSIFEDV